MIQGFKMKLYEGMAKEYEKRHNELWPEMKKRTSYLDTLKLKAKKSGARRQKQQLLENGGISWRILWKPILTTVLFL